MSVWKDKKNGKWIAKFWYQNTPYRKQPFDTKSAAREWEVRKRNELKNPPVETVTVSLIKLANQYLDDCRLRFQKNTWRSKTKYYRSFIQFIEDPDTPADFISKRAISNYLQEIAQSGGNKLSNRHLKDLKALYNWGLKRNLVTSNPFRDIDPYGEDQVPRYVPPAEDIHKVKLVATGDDRDIINCLYHTGARISEVFRLKWMDINFEKHQITIWTRKRRAGGLESDILSLTPTLHETLQRRWKTRNKESEFVFCRSDGFPITKDMKRNMMRDLCKKLESNNLVSMQLDITSHRF